VKNASSNSSQPPPDADDSLGSPGLRLLISLVGGALVVAALAAGFFARGTKPEEFFRPDRERSLGNFTLTDRTGLFTQAQITCGVTVAGRGIHHGPTRKTTRRQHPKFTGRRLTPFTSPLRRSPFRCYPLVDTFSPCSNVSPHTPEPRRTF
jgi:hypothetical protein